MADSQSYEYTDSDSYSINPDFDPDNEKTHLDLYNEENDVDPDNEGNDLDLNLFGNEYDWNDLDLTDSERDQNNTDMDLTDNERDQNNTDLDLTDNEDQNVTNFNQPHSTRPRLRKEKYPSSVWHHFTKTNKPVCKRCKTVFACKTATSTLRRHLNTHKIIAPKRRQRSLHDYRNDAHTEREQQERDNHVIRWIICDTQPFCVVDNNEWRNMISTFDPRYRFHNRHTIKDKIIRLYKEKKEQVKLIMSNIPGKAAFTSDMWTASNGTAFLSLTIHYIDASWELKSFLLDIIPMSVRHSGANIADAIMAVLYEFDLVEKTLALTTDNASSMLACGTIMAAELEREFDNLNFAHYRCAAHVLNLAVGQGIRLIDGSVGKVRALMTYIKSSHPLNEALKALCNMKGIAYLTPEVDVKTR